MDYWSVTEVPTHDYLGIDLMTKVSCECCSILLLLLFCFFFLVTAARSKNVDATRAADTDLNVQYPVCGLSLGPFNVLDLSFFSDSPYQIREGKPERIYQQFEVWFGNDTWDTMFDKDSIHFRTRKPAFYNVHTLPEIGNYSIVGVRGTYTTADIMQDIGLFSNVGVLQAFSYVVPLTAVLPLGFIRDWIYASSLLDGMVAPGIRSHFDRPVFEYLKSSNQISGEYNEEHSEHFDDETLILAGHSLGGALASIVAAKIADLKDNKIVWSFGVSNPGIVMSSSAFGVSVEAIEKTSISVYPRRDPIAKGDLHAGIQQLVMCDATAAIACHSGTRTMCELYSVCGRNSARNQTLMSCICDDASKTWAECVGLDDAKKDK
jgi:hypothetical protein